jgi:hypothetical protein
MALKRQTPPNRDRLMDRLYYDHETGLFIWLVGEYVGQFAGSINKSTGYVHISFDGIDYRAHHLAWLYVYGTWPDYIDHKDRIKIHNQIDNLREATSRENNVNASMRKDNSLGRKGVTRWGNKYRAQIQLNGVKTHIGLFDTIDEAGDAYDQKNKEHNGEFVCR